jgi:hypothetical protein
LEMVCLRMLLTRIGVVTFSNQLQRWDAATGFMLWESKQFGNVTQSIVNGQKMAVVSDGAIRIVNAKSGSIESSWTATGSIHNIRWLGDKLFAIGVENNRPFVSNVDGKQVIKIDLDPEEEAQLTIAGDWIVMKDKNDKIWTRKLDSSDLPMEQTKAVPIGSRAHRILSLPSQSASTEVAIQCLDNSVLIVRLDPTTGELKPLSSFDQRVQPTLYATAQLASGETFMAMAHIKPWKNVSNVEVANLHKDDFQGPFQYPYHFTRHGYMDAIYLDVFNKADVIAFRLLVIGQDDSMTMYENDQLLWTRNEALTQTVDSLYIDLPVENLLSKEHDELDESERVTQRSSPLARYLHRWRLHWQKFLKPRQPAIIQQNLTKDEFGLKKLIVFLSKSGKLTALESVHGKTVWSRFVGLDAKQVGAMDANSTYRGLKLMLLRSTIVKYPPILLVVGQGDSETVLQRISAMDGSDFLAPVLHRQLDPLIVYPGHFQHVLRLPLEESEERTHVVALVDSTNGIQLFPDLPSTRASFLEFAPRFFFYYAKIGSTTMVGRQATVTEKNGVFESVEVYKIEFPPGEVIAALGQRPTHGTSNTETDPLTHFFRKGG